MSLIYAPPPVATATGVEVVSEDGALTAVVHSGFPGVLLRVTVPGVREVALVRYDGATSVPVRSGSPCPLTASGEGWAYDAECVPGASYLYSIAGTESAVMVRLVDYAPCEAWLRSPLDPSLSLRLSHQIQHPWSDGDEAIVAVTDIDGGRTRVGIGGGVTMRAGRMVIRTEGVAQYRALRRLLATSEPLHLCASQQHGMDAESGLYLVQQGRVPDFLGMPNYRYVDTTVGWLEMARPATTVADPLRIPGWGWGDSTAGLTTAAAYAAVYPTTWDQLKAGVQGWSQ